MISSILLNFSNFGHEEEKRTEFRKKECFNHICLPLTPITPVHSVEKKSALYFKHCKEIESVW